MNRTYLIILVSSILILQLIGITTVIGTNSRIKKTDQSTAINSTSMDLHIQVFTNTRYIAQGNKVNITFGVYNDNYTYQSGVVVTFNFSGNQFNKTSASHLGSFILQINNTYSQVNLLATISTDQQELIFYGIAQKPNCKTYCTQAYMNATQLQVFTNYQTTIQLSIQTDTQAFNPNDMIEVTMPNRPFSLLLCPTNLSYFDTKLNTIETFSLPIAIPIISPGTYSFQLFFYSRDYYPVNISKQFTVANSAISYIITNTTVDRLNIGENPKDFITYQFNFTIANYLYNYYISNNQSIVYSASGTVSNVEIRLPIEIQFINPVGTYYINIELTKNNVIEYTRMVQITVYDNIVTNLKFNNILSDNQLTISFQLDTYLEDTLDNELTNVSILNADTNKVLESLRVNGTQYFSLTFPTISSIPTGLLVLTNSSNLLYHAHTEYYPVYYKDATTITTNYDTSIQVDRLQQLHLSVMVTDSQMNTSVTNGTVDMNIDGNFIQGLNLQNTNTFNYIIPVEFSIGMHSLTVDYLGSDSYLPSSKSYELDVYGNVHFANVSVNNTFTNPTTPILVSGAVLDENDLGVITRVSLLDGNNTILESTVTNVEGDFSFIILNSNIMGYYNYKLKAMTVNYYHTAEFQFNLLQNNAFSVNIQANETMSLANITIKGDIYGTYQLSYYVLGSNSLNITTFTLDSAGAIQTNFLTPDILGPIYFNVTNIHNPTQMWVQECILYKIPLVTIQQLNDAFVGEKVNISIQSDTVYRLFFNDQLVNNQLVYINKTILSLDVETRGINILKLEFTSQYITIKQLTKEIFVYEQTHLIQTLPAKINENTNITVYLQVVNNQNVPIGNVGIAFIYKGNVVFNKTTDNQGFLLTFITINDALENYNFRIDGNKGQYILQQDYPVNSTLIRTLTVMTNINALSFNDLTPTMVSFTVLYQGTAQPAPLVNMTIEILDQNQNSQNITAITSNAGVITIQIAKPVGTYILTIMTSDPNYIMAKSVYTIQVKGFDAINNPFILPALLIGSVGVLVIVKKKSLR